MLLDLLLKKSPDHVLDFDIGLTYDAAFS